MQHPVQDILNFWFSNNVKTLWFNSTAEFDQQLLKQFQPVYELARKGELNEFESSPEGALALVILFDQLPLNMFRGEARSFATEAEARRIAKAAIDKRFDRSLSDEQKSFLYMPLMHSEELADQERSVLLYEKAGLTDNLKFAHHHRDIIRRFGRFPHRNVILGRTNTEDEIAYLQSSDAFLG